MAEHLYHVVPLGLEGNLMLGFLKEGDKLKVYVIIEDRETLRPLAEIGPYPAEHDMQIRFEGLTVKAECSHSK